MMYGARRKSFVAMKLSLILLFASFVVSTGGFVQHSQTGSSDSCRFASEDEDADKAHKIMYNQQSRKREAMTYQIIAAEACEPLARRIEEVGFFYFSKAANNNPITNVSFVLFETLQAYPDRFTFHPTEWKKFPDGTDNIEIGGFSPQNVISGEHVLFLASFHNNDVTLSQFQVMICLLQSFVESMTVVLPYSPVGTMERVVQEGQVATAATYAHMFSSLPSCGRPTRLMVYDLHTLQNRFYLVRCSQLFDI